MKTACCLFLLSVVSLSAGRLPSYQTHRIVPEKELLITDTRVVDSAHAAYPGPFSFGYLIEELAGARGVAAFLEDWATLWEEDQTVNGHPVTARPAFRDQLIEPWQRKDGFHGEPGEEWHVNLANAPFRLLAIVNRLDLGAGIFIDEDQDVTQSASTTPAYYSSGTGPEVRFVFAALDPEGAPLPGGFTLILEYGPFFNRAAGASVIPESLSDYGAYWHELGRFPKFNDDYLDALARVTMPLTERETNPKLTGLKNARGDEITVELAIRPDPMLRQIRTNDRAFGPVHEFRQCRVSNGRIEAAMLSATPASVFLDETSEEYRYFVRYLNRNERAIKDGSHRFTPGIPGRSRRRPVRLLGGSALVPENDTSFHWGLRRVRDDEVRRLISMGTCNGCHAGETQTDFFHIAPRAAGQESILSDFLSLDGPTEIADPSHPSSSLTLNEMTKREVIFAAILDRDMRTNEIRRLLRERVRHGH